MCGSAQPGAIRPRPTSVVVVMSAALKAAGERGPSDDEPLVALLGRIAERDEAAFARLYDQTSRRVFGLALRILRDRDAASDATVETYWTVWQKARSFDPRRGRPLAWMLTVARSRAIDRLRAQRRRSANEERGREWIELADPAPGPEAASAHGERCVLLKAALESLPEEQRIAIETAFFSGLSHSEVAAELGEPLGTVKSRIRLGLGSLRRRLGEIG